MDPDITQVLGDPSIEPDERARLLLPLVYEQLRATAQRALNDERPGQTLQATALVHEAYLKLVGNREMPWQGRSHFFFAAAQAMRQILIDHARTKGRDKRGGGARRIRIDFEDVADLASTNSDTVLAVDEAICRLEEVDERVAQVAQLRLYAGLPTKRVADMVGVGERTVERDWLFARRWIARELLMECEENGLGTSQDDSA